VFIKGLAGREREKPCARLVTEAARAEMHTNPQTPIGAIFE
jgi:hypothetical protein